MWSSVGNHEAAGVSHNVGALIVIVIFDIKFIEMCSQQLQNVFFIHAHVRHSASIFLDYLLMALF